MSYCTGKYIEKARGEAVKEVVLGHKKISIVARRYGVNRSTIYRWKNKWVLQNEHVELRNYNRPSIKPGKSFRWASIRWNIPTMQSIPNHCPNSIDKAIVNKIVELRIKYKCCAELIWYRLNFKEGINISLSSVKRTIKRQQLSNIRRYKRAYRINPKRPSKIEKLGELVEVDTIHLVVDSPSLGTANTTTTANPNNMAMARTEARTRTRTRTRTKYYICTVIDLYSRMSYAKVFPRLSEEASITTILEAQAYMGFKYKMVQADNGPEFNKKFKDYLKNKGIETRHTRVRHPNDNAHIERFNRTLREECIGSYSRLPIEAIEKKLKKFTKYYNYDRVHLGLHLKTPAEMLQRS